MRQLIFSISHAMNRPIGKLSIEEIKKSINLVEEVISNKLFTYDKVNFRKRLKQLEQELEERK